MTWADECAALSRDVTRVADRLRSLSQARLVASVPGHQSRSAAALGLAQVLADLAAGVEGRDDVRRPVAHGVPDLGEFAVGDQVVVTGTDLVLALGSVDAETGVWLGEWRAPAGDVLTRAAAAVRDLRLLL